MRKDHPEIDMTPPVKEASSAQKEVKKNKGYVNIFNLRTQDERKAMLQQTLPNFVESKRPFDFHSPQAQRIHKSIFERHVVDLVPWHEVNKPGFIRSYAIIEPRFKLASDKYYRSLLDPTYDRLR